MIITRLANIVKLNERIHIKGLLLAQCLKLGSVLNGYPFHHHTPPIIILISWYVESYQLLNPNLTQPLLLHSFHTPSF